MFEPDTLTSKRVELFFPKLAQSVSALVTYSDDGGTVVRPEPDPDADRPAVNILAGSPVWLGVVSGRDMIRIPCVVQGVADALLLLTRTAPPERLAVRDRERYACRLPTVYRPIRPTGATGAWHEGELLDINIAGARLRIGDWKDFPARIDMRIPLPRPSVNGWNDRARDPETGSRTLRVSATIRYGRYTRYGETVVGLRFERLAPEALLLLGSYLEELVFAGAAR